MRELLDVLRENTERLQLITVGMDEGEQLDIVSEQLIVTSLKR